VREKLEHEVRQAFGKNQREAFLRQQLKAIQKELGEGADERGDELRDRLADRELPEEVRKVVDRELSRMDALDSGTMEFQVIQKYLEVIADLPWDAVAETEIDLGRVAGVLDDDHHGLDDVKKRILEHMAVLDLSGQSRATILCLAGPPGVGKTSLGESIARATDRPFVRIALGGVRDEAEIRGHRRTYVGALPGRIINALRKAEVRNPVVLLDEVDKLASGGWSGDPEAALLEVLDPEQNATFTDHFLEVPFDLSDVLFICTANDLSQLSAPLRDRLEIIEVSGYTLDEKAAIAREHLLPKRLADHAIPAASVKITDDALDRIVAEYTREAGVRQLNRQITKVCRAIALEYVQSGRPHGANFVVDADAVADYLGRPRYHSEVAARTALPGVATGLAWTPVGGDILFVETSSMPGKGNLQITGQLGDVMQESARAAMSYLRAHADELDIDPEVISGQDVHLHVPAGAVPKDGPSAGVTIFTALTSLLTGHRVRPDTAMTG
jgi:ATP-dependent Lon protease